MSHQYKVGDRVRVVKRSILDPGWVKEGETYPVVDLRDRGSDFAPVIGSGNGRVMWMLPQQLEPAPESEPRSREDAEDLADAREALAEGGAIAWTPELDGDDGPEVVALNGLIRYRDRYARVEYDPDSGQFHLVSVGLACVVIVESDTLDSAAEEFRDQIDGLYPVAEESEA